MNAPSTRPRVRSRRGFTLVELMVVIVIIGILIALLLPAITGAVRTARTGATSAEMNQLAQSLAQFKTQYGVYPPSRIILCESGNYSTTNLGAFQQTLISRSVSYLRKIWPKMVVSTTGNVSGIPGIYYDFNNNGVQDQNAYVIDGAECLVFFLGGLPGKVDGGWTTVGFSKNPANPAINSSVQLGFNRSSPMFEFRPGRLNDNYPVNPVNSGNGFPEYSDNLSASGTVQPFVYFSAYDGSGYDPNDANYPEDGVLTDGTSVLAIGSQFFNIQGPNNNYTPPGYSFAPNPYTNGPALLGGNTVNPEYINKNTFQIISAGIDGLFGPGGGYQGNAADPLGDYIALWPNTPPGNPLSPSMRLREKDNVTNFKGGRLD